MNGAAHTPVADRWLLTREVADATGWSIPAVGRHVRALHRAGSRHVRLTRGRYEIHPDAGVDAVSARLERRAWLTSGQLGDRLGMSPEGAWLLLCAAEESGHNLVTRTRGGHFRVHRAAVGDMRRLRRERQQRWQNRWAGVPAEERRAHSRMMNDARHGGAA